MDEFSIETTFQLRNPYAAVNDGGLSGLGFWRVKLCDGCCDDCCCCIIPTFVPCVGIAQAARAIMDRPSATALGVFFGILVLGFYVSGAIVGATSSTPKTTYEYESVYDYLTGTYDYLHVKVTKETIPRALGVTFFAFWVVYGIGLLVFRGAFRSKLQLPGNCCDDCFAAFFCSCCAVAQMRTHVKRGEFRPSVDILPAYRGS